VDPSKFTAVHNNGVHRQSEFLAEPISVLVKWLLLDIIDLIATQPSSITARSLHSPSLPDQTPQVSAMFSTARQATALALRGTFRTHYFPPATERKV